MKIALLGNGKTGSLVASLSTTAVTIFDSKTEITFDSLKGHDVIISFLPGAPFEKLIPLLIETKIPVVTGSTGFVWPSDINSSLESSNIAWIKAHNFSLGMNIVREMIDKLKLARSLFDEFDLSIHEIHHTNKVDAPSGTALSWDEWVGGSSSITSEREGDVVGDHTLIFDTIDEKITLNHSAKDRSIFARGALWAANYLINKKPKAGLHSFNELVLSDLGMRG